MADNELTAAILAAGMLPVLAVPDIAANGGLQQRDQEQLIRSIQHAVGLYRAILEGLSAPAVPLNASVHEDHHLRLVAGCPLPWPTPQNR
jgi:hypothetical protein